MIRFFKKWGGAAVLCLLLCASSCGAGELAPDADLPAAVAARNASFTAVFPAAYEGGEDVRCGGIRSGDTVTLTVREPARMADVTVTLRQEDGGFSAEISGPDFPAPAPVDPAASRALGDVFLLLYGADTRTDARSIPGEECPAENLLLPAVSRRGEETVFRYPAGTLVFDGSGLPARVLCRDMAGGERTVFFEDYVMEEP